MRLSDIHLRDPFILRVPGEDRFCLYGTLGTDSQGRWPGFPVFESADLENWSGPGMAFVPPAGFWSDRDFWAPEVHFFRGRYFMFATFKAPEKCRATQILVSDRPEGPFSPHGAGPVTPAEWECLDGTLWIEPDGVPWIVFCHEWLQSVDGRICARRLAPDLSAPEGDPLLLFTASGCPGVVSHGNDAEGRPQYVTDGPFLHRTASGRLLMLWSGFGATGYRLMVAASGGGLAGPWTTSPDALFDQDGGHGMLFRDLTGRLRAVLHRPNHSGLERPVLFGIGEKDGMLVRLPGGLEGQS